MADHQRAPTPAGPTLNAAWLLGLIGISTAAATGFLNNIGAPNALWVAFYSILAAWSCAAYLVERDDIKTQETDKAKTSRKRYRDRVGKLLIRLEALLLPKTVADNPMPIDWSLRFGWWMTHMARDHADLKAIARNPLSWPVHDFALRVAIVYPLLFSFSQFLIAGEAVTMAHHVLIPAETAYGWTLAVFGLVVLGLLACILATATSQFVYEKLARSFTVAAFAGSLPIVIPIGLPLAVLVAFEFPGAVASLVVVIGTFAVADAGPVAGPAAVVFAFALAALTFARCRRGHRYGQVAYLVLHAVAFGGALFAAILIPADNPATILIIAFALLPVVNALFDWLSYGFTIFLLREGHRRDGPWRAVFGLLDVLAAAILFFVLSLALIGTLVLVDAYRDQPLFDLVALLRDIQNGQISAHSWVLAMVASTLLPTLVHLSIGFFSLMTLVRGAIWDWLAARMSLQVGLGTQSLSSLGFAMLSLGYFIVPMVLLGGVVFVLWLYGGGIAAQYATWLLDVSAWLGWLSP